MGGFSSGFNSGFSVIQIIIDTGKKWGRKLASILRLAYYKALFEMFGNTQKERDLEVKILRDEDRLKAKAAQLVKENEIYKSPGSDQYNKEAARQYEKHYKIKIKKVKVKEEPKNYREVMDL